MTRLSDKRSEGSRNFVEQAVVPSVVDIVNENSLNTVVVVWVSRAANKCNAYQVIHATKSNTLVIIPAVETVWVEVHKRKTSANQAETQNITHLVLTSIPCMPYG